MRNVVSATRTTTDPDSCGSAFGYDLSNEYAGP
jgi:hypothetical protein